MPQSPPHRSEAQAPKAVNCLGSTGRWLVRTQTAYYEVDLDAASVTRHPDSEPGERTRTRVPPVATLRRDANPINLLAVHHCTLDEPAILLLDLIGDGTTTIRTTTPVLSIEDAQGDKEAI